MSDSTTDTVPPAGPDRGRRSWQRPAARGAAACAVCAAIAAGGYGIANASSASPSKGAITTAAKPPSTTPRSGGGDGPGPWPPGFPGRFPGGPGHFGFGGIGRISSIGSGSITIARPDGSKVTFKTDGSTSYREAFVKVSRSFLAVGDRVAVLPTLASTDAATHVAAVVDVVAPQVGGKVVSVSATTIVVEDGEGFWRTIAVSGSTTFEQGDKTVTAGAVKTGTYVVAVGQIAADHTTLDAVGVMLLKPGAPPDGRSFRGGPGMALVPGGAPGPAFSGGGAIFGGPGDSQVVFGSPDLGSSTTT